VVQNFNMDIFCSVPGCGIKMKDRVNGSHLKRKHNLNIEEYKKLYPNSELGQYKTNNFICVICGELISNKSEVKLKHILNHGLNSIDDYNIRHEIKKCHCGCNEDSDYSFIRHKYNDFKDGHYIVWNKGLTKENDKRVKNSLSGGWNKGLTMYDNDILKKVSQNVIKFWKNNPEKKIQMSNNVKKTMNKKYGVDNANDFPSFWAKYSDYHLPSGKIVRIQGYENWGLDLLLKNYHENDMIVDRKLLPKFKYLTTKTYTPDILISSIKTIYDIKSTWTYKIFKNKDEKIKAVNDAGFNFTIIIFNKKGEYTIKEYKVI